MTAATPESSRETNSTEPAQAAEAEAPAPSPLTYKGLSVTRPRAKKLWTGSLVAAVLAGAAVTPLILRGELLHSLRGGMYSAVASFAIHRAAAAGKGDRRFFGVCARRELIRERANCARCCHVSTALRLLPPYRLRAGKTMRGSWCCLTARSNLNPRAH